MVLDALPSEVEILHVATPGLALEPAATAREAVGARLADSALIAASTRIPPWVVDDVDAYRDRIDRVLGRAHGSVSEADLEFPEPDRTGVEGVRALLEHGPAVGPLTRGPNGALVVNHRRGRRAGAARQGGRHDRRRRRFRLRLPGR